MAIDKELAPFIDALAAAWPEPPLSLALDVWRQRVEQFAKASAPGTPPGLTVTTRALSADGSLRVRIYRPQGQELLPVLVYFHGGGWVIGSIDSHDSITAAIAAETPCVVVSVEYRRAPEHIFPAALIDCREAVRWVFANAAEIGGRRNAIFVGGDSAGANLAAALTLELRGSDEALSGQLLIYPCLDTDFTRPSFISEADAPFLNAKQMIWFWDQYCPTPAQRSNPQAVPMRAPDLRALPPAFVVVAEHDPLRDEGMAYAARLVDAGVAVVFRPGKGLIHGFLRARSLSSAVAAEYEAIFGWLRSAGQ